MPANTAAVTARAIPSRAAMCILLHAGAPLAAVITAALHRRREVDGTAERGDKQRDQDRDQRPHPLHQSAALQIGAARLLRRHDLVRLFDQRRDKPQRNGHHHRQLMYIQPQIGQRVQKPLERVGQRRRRRRIGQQRAARDQAEQPHRDKHSGKHALPA